MCLLCCCLLRPKLFPRGLLTFVLHVDTAHSLVKGAGWSLKKALARNKAKSLLYRDKPVCGKEGSRAHKVKFAKNGSLGKKARRPALIPSQSSVLLAPGKGGGARSLNNLGCHLKREKKPSFTVFFGLGSGHTQCHFLYFSPSPSLPRHPRPPVSQLEGGQDSAPQEEEEEEEG